MKLTEIAVDRPITTTMIVSIVVVFSAVALTRLPIDLMPDVSFPSLNVSVQYPGATPEEIETLITRPIEEAMGSVENVEILESSSNEGQARVQLRFAWGTNLDEAANDVRERLDRIRGRLPDDIEPPTLSNWDFNQSAVMRFGLASDTMPLSDLRYLAEHSLKPRLERTPGVAQVNVGGGRVREIQVDLAKEKLDAVDLAPQTVVQSLRAQNINLPAGEVYSGSTALTMRTQGQFVAPDELKNVVVATRDGVPIYLRDIADVQDGLEELRRIERINGKPGITMGIYRRSGSNTVAVAQATNKEIERIRQDYPELSIITLRDNSRFIENAISNVRTAALSGAVLAVVILLIFLRDLRSTLVIASAIPISVMASFSLIYFSGFTLNIVSFGGLALGVGLLVDNSIVVLENIFRHRERGQEARAAAIDGTKEVATAIIASTATTLVVFLPLLLLSGSASIMFTQLAYVVAFSLACSLVVSLTLIPTLARRLLRVESMEATPDETFFHKIYRVGEHVLSAIENVYRRTLHGALRHRYTVVVGSAALLAAILPIYQLLGFEYMPQADEGEVRVYGRMAPGTRLDAMDKAFTEVERVVWESAGDDIDNVYTEFGMADRWGGGTSRGSLQVQLTSKEERSRSSQEIADALRERLSKIPGLRVFTRASGGLFIFRVVSPEADNIQVEVRGYDRDTALQVAEDVHHALASIEGISDARVNQDEGRPEIGLRIDRYKAAEAGLTVSDIAQNIRTNFGGEIATRYREGGDEYDVRVRLQENDRMTLKDLSEHWIVAPDGERIPASNFLRQNRTSGPTEIERKNQERVIEVRGNLEPDYSLGNVMSEVSKKLNALPLPEGFTLYFGGEYEEQQQAYRELVVGLALAVLLVYMVMAAQFESFIHPMIIMFSIPFAAIGVLLILWMTGTTISVQSILGVIMLAGIVVNNAIVLVDYVNMLRRDHGMELREAVEEGGRRRLRPILMTTLTTSLALVPMAVGLGSGGELQAPMARVVIGGLLTSTLITLVLIPVLYTSVEEMLGRDKPKTASPSA